MLAGNIHFEEHLEQYNFFCRLLAVLLSTTSIYIFGILGGHICPMRVSMNTAIFAQVS